MAIQMPFYNYKRHEHRDYKFVYNISNFVSC